MYKLFRTTLTKENLNKFIGRYSDVYDYKPRSTSALDCSSWQRGVKTLFSSARNHSSNPRVCQYDKTFHNDANNCSTANDHHTPVMVDEVMSILDPKEDQVIIDMTFGAGGHSREILKRAPQLKQLIALDRDPLAHRIAVDLSKLFSNFAPGT